MPVRHRVPFSPDFNFKVVRPFIFMGTNYSVGDDFDKANVNVRLLERIYDQHRIDAVIPSLTITNDGTEEGDTEPEPVKAKGKKGKKVKVEEPAAPEPEPEAGNPVSATPKNYRLEANFGKVRIMDGETVVRECETLEEATAAMQELSAG